MALWEKFSFDLGAFSGVLEKQQLKKIQLSISTWPSENISTPSKLSNLQSTRESSYKPEEYSLIKTCFALNVKRRCGTNHLLCYVPSPVGLDDSLASVAIMSHWVTTFRLTESANPFSCSRSQQASRLS